MDDLGRINLIGGRNNSGKTSLLEALVLIGEGGDPHALLTPWIRRGGAAWDPSERSALWKEFFHGFDDREHIEISVADSEVGELQLDIETEWPPVVDAFVDFGGDSSEGSVPANQNRGALRFRFGRVGEEPVEARLFAAGPQAQIKQAMPPDAPFPLQLLPASTGINQQELANAFGDLRRTGRGSHVQQALATVEPRLQGVDPLPGSSGAMIWGDIGLPEQVPLPLMGQGMGNLARIAISIEDAPGGVVLIDEVDNGFHHSVIRDVWKVIAKCARDADTQVFATTHSYECFEAAVESLDPEDFRYHRLEVIDGTLQAVTYEHEVAATAVKHYMEVR